MYPLTADQLQLWRYAERHPTTRALLVSGERTFDRSISVELLQDSVTAVVRRHDVLRSRIAVVDRRPRQIVDEAVDVDMPIVDESDERAPGRAAAEVWSILDRPFDLRRGSLLRAAVLYRQSGEPVLYVAAHALIADRRSLDRMLDEVSEVVAASCEQRPSRLQPAVDAFADRRRPAECADVDVDDLTATGNDERRTAPALAAERDLYVSELPAAVVAGARELAAAEQASIDAVFAALWIAQLVRHTGKTDVALAYGQVVSQEEAACLAPCSAVDLLRVRLECNPSSRAIVRECRETISRFPPRAARRSAAIHAQDVDSAFIVVEHARGNPSAADLPPLLRTYDISLAVKHDGDRWHLVCEFDCGITSRGVIGDLLESYVGLLSKAVADPDLRVSCIVTLRADERASLQRLAMGPRRDPPDLTIVDAFARQVAGGPSTIAVQDGDTAVNYEELDRRANAVVWRLRERGIGPSSTVGLSFERSVTQIVAMLGIVKSGAAYVPLERTLPAPRLDHVIRDCGVTTVLCAPHDAARFVSLGVTCEPVEDGTATSIQGAVPANICSTHLAYVVYTSGSTGQPKGVAVTHAAVMNLITNQDYASFGPGSRVGHAATAAFDAATFEIWAPLLNGGTVVVVRPSDMTAAGLSRLLRGPEGLTTLFVTTALFRRLVDEDPSLFAAVGDLLFGGEAIRPATAARALSAATIRNLVHVYGPTETTTFATWWRLSTDDGAPIGRPLTNVRCYVVDPYGELSRVGAVGELYIGGAQLARGYVGDAGLTAARFVPDSFSALPGERLYRTGDRVRWRSDGALEFMGRSDAQIKVRGFRVEPAETEAALLQHDSVSEAAVVAAERTSGEKELVAYVVATATTSELGSFLRQLLPEYLCPARIVLLERLPLSASGKIDRRALERRHAAAASDASAVRYESAIEERVHAIVGSVLQQPAIGADQDLFALGGNSLDMVSIAAQVHRALGVEMALTALFRAPTIRAIAAAVEQFGGVDLEPAPLTVAPSSDRRHLLSAAQERVHFVCHSDPATVAYNFQSTLRFRGTLNVDVLRRSLDALVRRYDAFRMSFESDSSGTWVVVTDQLDELPLAIADLRSVSPGLREAELRKQVARATAQPFRLSSPPLVRWLLLRVAEDDHILLHMEHHIVHDGTSFSIFVSELAELYRAGVLGEAAPSPPPAARFADVGRWERDWLETDAAKAQRAYWREQLAGAPDSMTLPVDRPRSSAPSSAGCSRRVTIPAATYDAMRQTARRQGVSDFTCLLAAFYAVLHRLGGDCDLCVGVGIANRRRLEMQRTVGMLINNIALRLTVDPDEAIGTLLRRTWHVAAEGYQHQELPWNEVVRAAAPARTAYGNPLFNVMFGMHDARLRNVAIPGLTIEVHEGLNNGSAKFDLGIIVIPPLAEAGSLVRDGAPGSGVINIEYRSALFDEATIEQLGRLIVRTLDRMAVDLDCLVKDLPLLMPAEQSELLRLGTGRLKQGSQVTALDLFDRAAHDYPDAIAVRCGQAHLSYAELHRRADTLSARLAENGVGFETPAALFCDRSIDYAVGLLGILKAGGSVVPIDTDFPDRRVEAIVADAAASIMVSASALEKRASRLAANVIHVDEPMVPRPGPDATRLLHGSHIAYIVYTSGSTGRPKGVMVSHQALVNTLANAAADLALTPADSMAVLASFAFDISMFELLTAWLTGACSVIVSHPASLDPMSLSDLAQDVTIVHAVPGLARQFAEALRATQRASAARRVLTGGDRVPPDLIEELRATCPGATLQALYGPTEAAMFCAAGVQSGGATHPPLGRPIANLRLYVLDATLQLAPHGVVGELYIAGEGVARGYLRRPTLTAERFVADPFVAGERMYRTGDRARWCVNGTLAFAGRVDHQVKVRGFRVELGEIEAALLSLPGVAEAVVVPREDASGHTQCVAYVRPADGHALDARETQRNLAQTLPAYMVPGAIVPLDVLPVGSTGKVDRRALAARPLQPRPAPAHDPEPVTELQRELRSIWQAVLALGDIGLHDNFFDCGGHSLLAMQVLSRVTGSFHVDLTINELFEAPTIVGLGAVIQTRLDQRSHLIASSPAAGERRFETTGAATGAPAS